MSGLTITITYPGSCVSRGSDLLVKVTSKAHKRTGAPALRRVGFSIDGVTINGRPTFIDARKPFAMQLNTSALPAGLYHLHAKLFLRRLARNFKRRLDADVTVC